LVAESYLSDHRIHHQQIDGINLSSFQRDFLRFCQRIAKFGCIKELLGLASSTWIFPLVVAQLAIDDAHSEGYFHFLADYRMLSRHPDNDIERIADSRLRPLAWVGTDNPTELGTMDGSLFLSRIARQVLFLVRSPKFSIK
jgi:hypothetical protein